MPDTLDFLKAALAERYTIQRELGAGGMATVYLAHDVRHGRRVARKPLRPTRRLGTRRSNTCPRRTATASPLARTAPCWDGTPSGAASPCPLTLPNSPA